MVKAEEKSPEALLASLKAGDYYSSTGPEIHDIRFTNVGIEVACSEAATIVVQGKGSSTATLHGHAMTGKSLSLDRLKNSPWIRVTVIDSTGKRAWSNPIWLEG